MSGANNWYVITGGPSTGMEHVHIPPVSMAERVKFVLDHVQQEQAA